MEVQKQLTVAESIAQGYTSFIYNNDGFQTIKSIEHDDPDFTREDISLVEKEFYHPAGLDGKAIAERLADQIQDDHSWDSGDDSSDVYDAIMAIDFSDVAERIDKVLEKLKYYRSANIKLIP